MKAGEIRMEVAAIALLPAESFQQSLLLRNSSSSTKKTRRGKKRKSTPFTEEDSAAAEKLECSSRHQPPTSPPSYLEDDDPSTSNNANESSASPARAITASPTAEIEEHETCSSTFFGLSAGAVQQQQQLPDSFQPSLRPVAPKAPNNFNQFLMDEHEDSNLYYSFETPRSAVPRRVRRSTDCTTTSSESAGSPEQLANSSATWDCTDHQQYELADDFDTDSFFARDFEQNYRRAREEELLTLPRQELVEKFIDLEDRAVSLQDSTGSGGGGDGANEGPAQLIARLQDDLLRLQEENAALKRSNRNLAKSSECLRHAYEQDAGHARSPEGDGHLDWDASDEEIGQHLPNDWSSDDDDNMSSCSSNEEDNESSTERTDKCATAET